MRNTLNELFHRDNRFHNPAGSFFKVNLKVNIQQIEKYDQFYRSDDEITMKRFVSCLFLALNFIISKLYLVTSE